MNRRVPSTRLFLLLLFLSGNGCGGEGGITEPDGSSVVSLALSGLEPLSGGLHYQAWLIAGTPTEPWGSPLVIFNVDVYGQLVDPVADTVLTGPFQGKLDPDAIQGIGVSLETSDVLLAYSSYTFILGGDVVQGTASLSTDHWIALAQGFSQAEGGFVLATPTDEDEENELEGVWFMDPTSVPLRAGLELPPAPEGWAYEGWVTLEGQPLSVGKFVLPNEADSAGVYSGTVAGPPFPGEDFLTGAPAGLTFPPTLSGALVSVTLEPWMELDVEPSLPFFLRILEAQIPTDPVPLTFYGLLPPAQLPTGTATIQ